MRGSYQKCLSFLFLIVFIAFFTGELFSYTGKISGRVYDKDTGKPLPAVNILVYAKWVNGKVSILTQKFGAASDENGYFYILNVPPGVYSIKATMIGYTPMIKEKVVVNMDRTVRVDFALKQATIEMEAISVVAEREVIKPDVAGTQEIIKTDRITESPSLRVDEFVNKIKGVELVASSDGYGLSIRGGAIRETDVQMDGISLRDPRSENSYLSINSTAIEEIQVLTGGFEAKYGGFRSGLLNIVTKEGSREKYSFSFKFDVAPAGQRKFFGENPWGKNSILYRIFADTTENGWAWIGTINDTSGLVPEDLKVFRGWKDKREGRKNYEVIGLKRTTKLTPEQKRELWLLQHPNYPVANRPDYYIEGTVTGPVPGKKLPLVGKFLGKSTFLLGGKYENTLFAYPIGPRPHYIDWNVQTKIVSYLRSNLKLSTNFMYAEILTNTADRPTSFGGALMDYSSKFSFLSSTQKSVEQQARILGSGSGFVNMFNRSRLQYLTQRWVMGGMKLNHTLSHSTFYTVDLQFSYHDNMIEPFASDTSDASSWTYIDSTIRVLKYPKIGTPNASTNYAKDITDLFFIYGGLQQADSSYNLTVNLKFDVTSQVNRYHLMEFGFSLRYTYCFVNSGTWYQSEKLWTPGIPGTWQYYRVRPLEAGIYFQDKLEFEGMIANIGIRGDYFDPNKKPYLVEHPLDEDFTGFYNLVYENLEGKWGSWERWKVFREMLDNPPGWPTKKKKVKFKLSPRLGVSFPVTVNSKMYFNYGHFYQRPNISFVYNIAVVGNAAIVPSPDLDMGKTVAYEFGYEQRFLRNFLFNVSMYYKNVKNEPLARTYIDYWQEVEVTKYYPDAFSDIRGIELRLEKNIGKFFTFWSNYEYMLKSWGQTGLRYVYENRLQARDEERDPNIITTEPDQRAHVNINFHTPSSFGPSVAGTRPLGGINLNFLVDWKDGGKVVIEYDPTTGEQKKADVVDYSNVDLRASKLFRLKNVKVELVLTVVNLFNQKRLFIGGMSSAQYDRYRESLHFPFEEGEQKGNDKWGEWNKEHIDVGWFTTPIFINPRRILVGLRVNF